MAEAAAVEGRPGPGVRRRRHRARGVRGAGRHRHPRQDRPAGTGNLLARNLDIPLYIRAAIDVALTGQDRAVDMVEVSGDGFEDTTSW